MSGARSVALEEISSAFEGMIPSVICTVADDGTPNVTYLSVVHPVDATHVALSRQFFNKTDDNTIVNPLAQVLIMEADTGRTFWLDVVYERTVTEGPLFERMRTNLDAVAAHEGMENVFKLKGTDVCRVESCVLMPGEWPEVGTPLRRDVTMAQVEEFASRLAVVDDMDELLAVALRTCGELLHCPHVFIMLVDETGERLYTVASTGFAASGAGSEVRIGEGLIGLAAARKQAVRIAHMGRELSYAQASLQGTGASGGIERVIPLPQLHTTQSQLVVPMLAHRKLVGMLCLESEAPGAFKSADECVASILASQIAMAMATLVRNELSATSQPAAIARPVEIKHYSEDDSVFFDNEYVIKGVAGGILWRLLRTRDETGRNEFSNKEIRLDPSLDLPDIKDNLEARLILLRRRLEERCDYIHIDRVARGRFRLQVERPLTLVQVDGGGPL